MTTGSSDNLINTTHAFLTTVVKNGIIQISTEDKFLHGRIIQIDGQMIVNFGSCNFLGLQQVNNEHCLKQIQKVLMSNAFRCTNQNEVEIKSESIEQYASELELRFQVRDTDIGIEPPNQRRVFDVFAQKDITTTMCFGWPKQA